MLVKGLVFFASILSLGAGLGSLDLGASQELMGVACLIGGVAGFVALALLNKNNMHESDSEREGSSFKRII